MFIAYVGEMEEMGLKFDFVVRGYCVTVIMWLVSRTII